MNLLFICSRNQWRSPTAEKIFRNEGYQTKSAGTAAAARTRVSEKLIEWADIIFVMENKHRQILQERFSHLLYQKEIVVLNIADEYGFMDGELIANLRISVLSYLIDK